MNCPVCNRNLVATLSICPACGAMMNDSVREELKTKISTVAKPLKIEPRGKSPMPAKPIQQSIPKPLKPVVKRPVTMELASKPTSPTLVEFQNKNAALPEWRLQLQNAVRKRLEKKEVRENAETPVAAAPKAVLVTDGAAALTAEAVEETEPILHENEKVQNALRRIEASRKRFLVEDAQEPPPATSASTTTKKEYPFYIASKSAESVPPQSAETKTSINFAIKPKLVSSAKIEKKKFDTNKLPPLPAKVAASFERGSIDEIPPETEKAELPEIKISRPQGEDFIETEEAEIEEFEDCAPFTLRFNAGLFDLIIGAFASAILLAPFVFLGGDWFTWAGLLAFLATCSIVMFVYLTTAIGLFGKTFGMRLFALEVIDIEENDYPNFHQAAVSSSVYLLSLALGGTGFLTIPFTAERRAVHDLVSGTVVVKEFA